MSGGWRRVRDGPVNLWFDRATGSELLPGAARGGPKAGRRCSRATKASSAGPRGDYPCGVSGTLKKPKAQVYRSSLYLNADAVVNALAAIEGGDVDEVLVRQADEGGHDLGGGLGAGSTKAKAGKRRARRHEEEMRRRRTEHSAATLLMRKLHEQEAIGRIEGEYGREVYDELEENMVLEFAAEIRIHPLHQAVSAARAFLRAAPGFGLPQDEIRQMTETIKLLESIVRSGTGESTFLLFADTSGAADGYRLILPIYERSLEVGFDDLVGRATFVAQVDRLLTDEDELLAMRLLRNAPQLAFEREGIEAAVPDLMAAFSELGLEVGEDDFFLRKPSVILKPIWIYR